jgi:DNA repair protein RecO (recombination protein O)
LKINRQDRRVLLQKIICFYELHLANWGHLKSMQIMQEVLS